jgi:hypothetical protein
MTELIPSNSRTLSEIHKQRIGAANRGKTRRLTDQHKANIRRAQAAYYQKVQCALALFEDQQSDVEGV